jgi:hypothetical protein
MTEALANLAGVLIVGALLGVEVWVVAIGLLAWVVASPRPIPSRIPILAALLLSVSVVAYIAAVVLIGVVLESLV